MRSKFVKVLALTGLALLVLNGLGLLPHSRSDNSAVPAAANANQIATPAGSPAMDSAASPAADEAEPLAEWTIEAAVDNLPAPPAIVELNWVQVAPEATWEVIAPGPALYGVTDGALGIRVMGPALITRSGPDGSPQPAEPAVEGIDYTLRPGDSMLVPSGTQHLVRNDGSELAVALSTVIYPSSAAIPSWLGDGQGPAGVTLQPIASDLADTGTSWPTASAGLRVERMALDPGETHQLPTVSQADGYGLIVVEEGTVTVAPDGGADGVQTHSAGTAARLEPETTLVARNDGTARATAVLVTLFTAEDV